MKKTKKKKKFSYSKTFPFLLIIATLFMSIGYASINSITSEIKGVAGADKYEGVLITDVKYLSNVSADTENSKINTYYQTLLSSTVVLSDTDATSSITYEVDIKNNSDRSYTFAGLIYDGELYDNDNIVITLDGLEVDDILAKDETRTVKVTFSYKDGTLADNKTLNSYINFSFKKILNITYKDFYEDGYTDTIVEDSEISITFPEYYKSLALSFADNSGDLGKDVHYTYEDNILKLFNIDKDIVIQNLTRFCTDGSSFRDCLVATDGKTQEIETAEDKIESKVADFSKIEPYLTYSEDKQYNLKGTSLASTYNLTSPYYYTTTEPSFNTTTGQYTLLNGQYGTIDNLISSADAKYYTCFLTSSATCSMVYTVYEISNTNGIIRITNADKFTYSIDEGYSSNPGLYYTNDDLGKSYYYRGEVNNNWVNFAGYLWRIIRINGDNSIRLIYSGTESNHTGTSTAIKYTAFNSNGQASTYIGYMYNSELELNSSPSSSIVLSSSTKLSRFPTTLSITREKKYYFFKNFDLNNTYCQNEVCTLTGTLGSDVIYDTWYNLASNNYSTDSSDGATSTLYKYTSEYTYTCFDNQNNISVNGDTITITCPIVDEILGTVKNGTDINETQAVVRYSGYFSKSYENSVKNVEDSNAKKELDAWYENHLLTYESYLTNGIFCNDRSFGSNNSGNGYTLENLKGTNIAHTFYGAYSRAAASSIQTPTLKCTNLSNDGFTLKTNSNSSISGESGFGNNMLDYPIGLITGDEVMYAGGYRWVQNSKYWLYTGQYYWTSSPYYFSSSYALARSWDVTPTGSLGDLWVTNAMGLRPVINLKASILYSSGSGTVDDPYEVKLASE